MSNKLIKASFIQKIVRQRLSWKYKIDDIDFIESSKLYKEYKEMVESAHYEQELLKTLPISTTSFHIMRDELIVRMKKVNLIPPETTMEEIDLDYVEALLESLLYAHKVYLFCTVVNPNAKVTKLKLECKGPFIKAGYDTLLDLALIYDNNYDSSNLNNIGPVKFKEFQKFFALKMGVDVVK